MPYHDDGAELRHLLLMSLAGESLASFLRERNCIDWTLETLMASLVRVLKAIHRDVAPRNNLFDVHSGSLTMVDSERSEIQKRQPLGKLSRYRQRKRKFDGKRYDYRGAQEIDVSLGRCQLEWVLDEAVTGPRYIFTSYIPFLSGHARALLICTIECKGKLMDRTWKGFRLSLPISGERREAAVTLGVERGVMGHCKHAAGLFFGQVRETDE